MTSRRIAIVIIKDHSCGGRIERFCDTLGGNSDNGNDHNEVIFFSFIFLFLMVSLQRNNV